ncbi:MAG: ATPase, T2SS/T4P/T4SS family, partial [Pseudomonadota bacterium]
MFGKKGSNKPAAKAPPPPKKEEAPKAGEAVKKDAPAQVKPEAAPEAKPDIKPELKAAPEPKAEKAPEANEMLQGLGDALAKPAEEPKEAAPKPELKAEEPAELPKKEPVKKDPPKKAGAEKDAPKLDDPFAEDMAAMEAEADGDGDESGDSITTLRLQRARNRIWLDLRDGIDLKALANMEAKSAREEVFSAVEEIARFRNLDLTPAELQSIAKECSDDMLGFGPLEELLERDDIADIMINGPDTTYIEVGGIIEKARIKFRDNQHLTTICQRIVGAIGRRVDEASPICDARLPDGSRVNVIIPPLAVDGACMTIRKFTKDKLTLDKLMEFGSMTPSCAKLIMAIGRCRVNVLVSGGTGSGKTTMLNCLTRYIEPGERIVTCEDACELQLQQPHVVRLETRPPNLEGVGEVTMRDLVKNCLRMRPERIIVGEVRGPEAFDLL